MSPGVRGVFMSRWDTTWTAHYFAARPTGTGPVGSTRTTPIPACGKWRVKSNYPIVAGWTPTVGGLLFFGDVGGNLYALDSSNGQKLWGQALDGAIAGGVITYMANGAQKVAVAAGFAHSEWPTIIRFAKIAVLGLDEGAVTK